MTSASGVRFAPNFPGDICKLKKGDPFFIYPGDICNLNKGDPFFIHIFIYLKSRRLEYWLFEYLRARFESRILEA